MKIVCLMLLLVNLALPLWEWRSAEPLSSPASQLPSFLLEDEYRRAGRGATISSVFEAQIGEAEQMVARDVFDNTRSSSAGQTIESLLRSRAKPAREPMPTALPEATSKVTLKPTAKPTSVPTVTPKPKITAPSLSVTEVVKPVSEAVVAPVCYQVGPFADQAALAAWLKSQGLKEIATFSEENESPVDFQVLYPAAKSPEQQRLNKQMLNEKGIVDLWTVPAGETKGALSLGVFTSIERANVYRQELLDKGVKAEIKQRFKSVPRFYANVILNKDRYQQLLNRGTGKLASCR